MAIHLECLTTAIQLILTLDALVQLPIGRYLTVQDESWTDSPHIQMMSSANVWMVRYGVSAWYAPHSKRSLGSLELNSCNLCTVTVQASA